jgi:hypothetical protein
LRLLLHQLLTKSISTWNSNINFCIHNYTELIKYYQSNFVCIDTMNTWLHDVAVFWLTISFHVVGTLAVWCVSNVMEKNIASVFRVDDIGNRFLWNISHCLGHHHKTKSHEMSLGIHQWTNLTTVHNIIRHHCCTNNIWEFFQRYVVSQLTHKQEKISNWKLAPSIHLSTETAIYTSVNNVLSFLNHKKIVGGLFCGLKKATDCVNYDILLSTMRFYGISGVANKLMESYK